MYILIAFPFTSHSSIPSPSASPSLVGSYLSTIYQLNSTIPFPFFTGMHFTLQTIGYVALLLSTPLLISSSPLSSGSSETSRGDALLVTRRDIDDETSLKSRPIVEIPTTNRVYGKTCLDYQAHCKKAAADHVFWILNETDCRLSLGCALPCTDAPPTPQPPPTPEDKLDTRSLNLRLGPESQVILPGETRLYGGGCILCQKRCQQQDSKSLQQYYVTGKCEGSCTRTTVKPAPVQLSGDACGKCKESCSKNEDIITRYDRDGNTRGQCEVVHGCDTCLPKPISSPVRAVDLASVTSVSQVKEVDLASVTSVPELELPRFSP